MAATFVTCTIIFFKGLLVILWAFDEFSSFKDGIDFYKLEYDVNKDAKIQFNRVYLKDCVLFKDWFF
jgi:hypothetical protein